MPAAYLAIGYPHRVLKALDGLTLHHFILVRGVVMNSSGVNPQVKPEAWRYSTFHSKAGFSR